MLDVTDILSWFGHMGLGNIISAFLFVATSIFVGLVYRQIRQEKDELAQKNMLETFVQIDRYRENVFHQYSIVDKLLHAQTPPNSDDSQREIIDLLDDMEMLALKCRKLGLDVEIIYDILGRIIIDLLQTDIIKDKIKEVQRDYSGAFGELERFVAKLRQIAESGSSHRGGI